LKLKKLQRIDSTKIQLLWDDGHVGPVSLKAMRAACPCAGCQGETVLLRHYVPPPKPETTPEALDLKNVEVVGNYAVRPTWADGHDQGIYTWEHLRSLCECEQCSGGRGASAAARNDQ
jgi:DUF971 family protein